MDFQVSSSLFGNLLTLFALQESAVTCCEYVVDCPPDVRKCSDKLFLQIQLQSLDYSLPLCCRVKRKEVLRLVFKVSRAHFGHLVSFWSFWSDLSSICREWPVSGGVAGKEASGPHELLGERDSVLKFQELRIHSSSDGACGRLCKVLGHNRNCHAATA